MWHAGTLIRKLERAALAQSLMNNLNVDDDSALASVLAVLETYTVESYMYFKRSSVGMEERAVLTSM